MKKICYGISITAILLFLFLYPSQALTASRTGLHLWFDTLLPTLLPFMILSGILIRADLVRPLVALLSPFFQKTLMLSPGGTYALFMGFLCGCPMGAKTVSDLLARGQLTLPEAQYLLGFCNNISPSFIITFLVTEQLGRPALMLPSLVILYGSPLFYGILTNPSYRRASSGQAVSLPEEVKPLKEPLCFGMVDVCILDGVITIVRVGGYIMLFALLAGVLQVLPIPLKGKALLTAMAEITNGIPALIKAFPYPASFLLLMCLTAFGGLSAIVQTDSVLQKADGKTSSGNMKNAHLSLWKYVRSKLIISALALFLSLCFLS